MSIAVRVPGSSANLGPGFDVLAMALGVHATVGFVGEPGPARARQLDEFHPASVAYRRLGGARELWAASPIPAGRGMGFSGAMRVGGAALAVAERGDGDPSALELGRDEVLAVAAELEGHADNAAASVHGGVVVASGEHVVRVPLSLDAAVVLWVPDTTTSTNRSRAALPDEVTLADAVFNIGRASMLVAALASGDTEALRLATDDRLHQDVRLERVPQSRRALADGLDGGAWCGWLSGSGPTIAFLCDRAASSDLIRRLPAGGRTKVVEIDREGVMLI